MPCRAAPPPPPPPHSTQDLTPSPAALSNPLVYRLRTCCLQEFLPRVSLVQKSTPLTSTPRPRSSPTQLSILFDPQDHNNSNFDPRLSSHSQYPPTTSPHSPNSYSNSPLSHPHPQHPQVNPIQHHDNNHPRQEHVHQEQHGESYAPPQQQQNPLIEEDRDLPDSLANWQPPASNIQLTQLQSALAHRFLDWALSENVLSLPSSRESETAETNNTSTTATAGATTTTTTVTSDDAEGEQEGREQQERSIVSVGQDWAAAHDLVWPEGDYYMAKKTFIREGVAHLKRGRRYIFVEPVLGPATSYLYPKWVDSEEDEGVESAVEQQQQQQQQQEDHSAGDLVHDATTAVDISSSSSTDQSSSSDSGNDAPVQPSMASSLPTTSSPATVSEDEQDKDHDDDDVLSEQQQKESVILDDEEEGGRGNDKDEWEEEEDKEFHKEEHEAAQESQHHDEASDDISSFSATTEEDRAQEGLVAPLSPPSSATTTTSPLGGMDGERIEKEETDDSSAVATSPPSSTASVASATNNSSTTSSPASSPPSSSSSTRSSFEETPSSPLQQHQSTELLEPYSPLLDPSTDGQDQFEYGLYELQFIPKIQYLLPSQFLPSRQSFIVHLDEDRPTLASPVPAHSKRSECRCQLMMRKVLMHRDLLQVWPPIPPVRTLQERQQEAEEEARMMEVKQKVQLQTSNWRKTLQTQMVACR